MPRPRRLGSSSSLNRSLSRLSSSTSFSARQSNVNIYTYLIAGCLILLVTVGCLQVHLLRAPQGSKLSPLEKGKSDEGVGAHQAWWKDNSGVGNTGDLDPATGKPSVVEKGKLGRKIGAVQGIGDNEEGDSNDDDMDAGEEMGDDGDEDEDADQNRFDIDIDDRVLEEESEDLEDVNLGFLAEMSNEEASAAGVMNKTDSHRKPGQNIVDTLGSVVTSTQGGERVASVRSVDSIVNNDKGVLAAADSEKMGRQKSNQEIRGGKVSAIPDWVLDSKLSKRQSGNSDQHQEGFQRDLVEVVGKRKGSFFWDHALGVRKKPSEDVDSISSGETKDFVGGNINIKRVGAGDEGAARVAGLRLRGFKEVVRNWKERFNSDDELIDDNLQLRLEGVREIEDALLLNGDGAPDKPTSSKKKKGRGAFDPMNPVNNPMLQDPDTSPGTWMTKSDKEMLRAMRGDHLSGGVQLPKVLLEVKTPAVVTEADSESGQPLAVKANSKWVNGEKTQAPPADVSGLLGSEKLSRVGESVDKRQGTRTEASRLDAAGSVLDNLKDEGKALELTSQNNGVQKQWGFYPGMESSLSFSNFMTAFLGQESCTVNFFLAWTTPAWGFTARHQRVLESLFRFHRNACVVVFSETFEFDFFKSFTKDGYKVAVVRPDLQDILADTPSDVFVAVLPKWKEKPLFHLHYTELLRLAILYKFGGIYMDMDMIVVRPLDNLRNTVGSEITASGQLRLNGAILIFDKSSPFLKKCLEEFTSTYDEALVQWNGADLVTRVANSSVAKNGSTWIHFPDLLNIQGSFSFFPLHSKGISKFFAAPKDDIHERRQRELLTRIAEEAYTVHLWNSVTSNVVPEVDSLVGTILSRSCLRCKDVL